MWLELKDVSLSYAQKAVPEQVLKSLSFSLKQGDIACLLGRSGCGKTTALRAIAGFECIDTGMIHLGEQLLSSKNIHVSAHTRNIGMVFQDYALFPHLNVFDNIAFGLKKQTKAQRIKRVEELLKLTDLSELAHHYPHELSGGQQQRVALARALAPRPKLLLLDEPFSSLDTELRERLARQVRNILKTEGVTAIIVTHDQHEAFAIADWVGVMHNGSLEQWATPYQLYHEPITRYVAQFIEQGVLLPAQVIDDRCVELELGHYCGQVPAEFSIGDVVEVLVRPDDIVHDDNSPQKALVKDKAFQGANFIYTLALPSGNTIFAQVPSHHNHAIGESIGIVMDMNHLIIFRCVY